MMWKAKRILIGVASCLINVLKNLICSTRNTLYTYHVYIFSFVIRMDISTTGYTTPWYSQSCYSVEYRALLGICGIYGTMECVLNQLFLLYKNDYHRYSISYIQAINNKKDLSRTSPDPVPRKIYILS